MQPSARRPLVRNDERVILHFDYDCFYASVVENIPGNAHLKSLPLAIQQKQIVVTCNYEARRRGLRKLQLISEAKRICPDMVIILGEDLTLFRDASKDLYHFLKESLRIPLCERLGFDEVRPLASSASRLLLTWTANVLGLA
jgi:DNA polymerase iota